MDSTEVRAYLDRIGVTGAPRPDRVTLGALQLAHLRTVPFENLSIHLGEPIVLDETALFDKVVTRRRGGFCYELNGAFAALLTALGYRVELLSARVFGGGEFRHPLDHMALRVHLDEPWLVDVGFGKFSHQPLRLASRAEQVDPGGPFRVEEQGPFGELDVLFDGRPEYRLDPRPYALSDFAPTCWFQQTSPDSHFTRSLTCSRLTEDGGRITLSGRRLIETLDGRRVEHTIEGDALTLDAYRKHFGIELDRVPTVSGKLDA